MKILRSILMPLVALALGLVSMVSTACDKAWEVATVAARSMREGWEDLACGVDKLKRELVQCANRGTGFGVGISAGLRRESNGYRQDAAQCNTAHLTPSWT